MSNTPISNLPAVTPPVSPNSLVAIVQSGVTDKATVSQLVAGLPDGTQSVSGLLPAADKVKLDSSTSTNTNSSLVQRDSSGNFSANAITAAQVTITGAPSAATDGTNKAYVDAVAVGLTIKAAAKAATTANVTLAGGAPSTLDGISLLVNDRILVKDQSDAKQNGIYIVGTVGSGANGTWTRATDADTGVKLPTNSYVFVNSGTTNGSTSWVMITSGAIVIGTSNIVWALFNQITQIPAANITGQIVASQIADLQISTAKFAAGLTPVEIVSTVPTSSNFKGRMIYLTTTDGSFAPDKVYRWTSATTTGNTFWTSVVPTVDLTGQITTTQITDSAISTPKIASGAITTAKLTANCITSNELAANSVVAGKIQAGAITATEIAVGTIDKTRIANGTLTTTQIAASTILGSNIAAGTIAAGNLTVSTLSSITANIGTITAGSLTASTSINVGAATKQVQIDSTNGLLLAGGKINLGGDGTNPWIKIFGSGAYTSSYIQFLSTSSGAVPPGLTFVDASSTLRISANEGAFNVFNGTNINIGSSSKIQGPGKIEFNTDSPGSRLEWSTAENPSSGALLGYIPIYLNGRTVKIPFYDV